jgi:hypothetical protein
LINTPTPGSKLLQIGQRAVAKDPHRATAKRTHEPAVAAARPGAPLSGQLMCSLQSLPGAACAGARLMIWARRSLLAGVPAFVRARPPRCALEARDRARSPVKSGARRFGRNAAQAPRQRIIAAASRSLGAFLARPNPLGGINGSGTHCAHQASIYEHDPEDVRPETGSGQCSDQQK